MMAGSEDDREKDVPEFLVTSSILSNDEQLKIFRACLKE